MKNRASLYPLVLLLWSSLTGPVLASLILDFDSFNARNYGTADGLMTGFAELNDSESFPATLSGLTGLRISSGYLRWNEYANFYKITCGYGNGRGDAFAGSLVYAGTGERPLYDDTGNPIPDKGDGELMLSGAYAFPIRDSMALGLGFKWIRMDLYGYKSSWLGTGLSGLMRLPERWIPGNDGLTIGASLVDIPIVSPQFHLERTEYPSRIHTGFRYDTDRIPLCRTSAGSLLTIIPALSRAYLSIGCELEYDRFIIFRSGVFLIKRDQDLATMGLGIRQAIPRLGPSLIDYSIVFLKSGVSHYFQISFTPEFHQSRISGSPTESATKPVRKKIRVIEPETEKIPLMLDLIPEDPETNLPPKVRESDQNGFVEDDPVMPTRAPDEIVPEMDAPAPQQEDIHEKSEPVQPETPPDLAPHGEPVQDKNPVSD